MVFVTVAGKARLLSVLRPAEGGLLWRTAKVDVVHELKLPQQTHRLTYLTLNAIERHFYIAQHKVPFPSTLLKCCAVHLGEMTCWQAVLESATLLQPKAAACS